jgi:anaerobic magnesium-protoporphyrin IX monomethyl ester cyclase
VKIFFLHPPVANVTQPPLGIPSLVAYLRHHGLQDISVFDLNVAVMEALLEPERLRRAYRWCYHWWSRCSSLPEAEPLPALHQRLASQAVQGGANLEQAVDRAKATMRGDGFYRPVEYLGAMNAFLQAYCLLSARYFPTVLSYQSLSMRYRCDTSSDLLAATVDERENPFIELLAEAYRDGVAAAGVPDWAGISIAYYEQLIPGLTLARCIKESTPGTHVTVGGSLISALHGKPIPPQFFDLFDSAVFFEGEEPVLRLVTALDHGDDLDAVPSACFRRQGAVVYTASQGGVTDVGSLPTPSFGALSGVHYMSPSPILPVAASRGCYWQKCTFCTRRHFQPTYRPRDPQRIVDDLGQLAEAHHARHFSFVDECIPPAVMQKLAREIAARGLPLQWSCYVRFDRAFLDRDFCRRLAAGGLRMLYFGMESACQRILDLMGKGTPRTLFGDVLRNTTEAGIMNMILYFVGFPTETQDEALESMNFLLEHQEHVTYAVAGHFLLEEHSPIYQAPDRFGITRISPLSENADLTLIYDYQTNAGMDHGEIERMQQHINERTQHLHSLQLLNRSHLLVLGQEYARRQRAEDRAVGGSPFLRMPASPG